MATDDGRGRGGLPLPLPPHHDPANAARWEYAPDQAALFDAAVAWRREHAIPPAAADGFDLHLLLIDMQKDFCFPRGTLYVGGRSGTGAIDDTRRTAEFLYRHLDRISNVTVTLDTHLAFQIFFAPFWTTADGGPVAPLRTITTEDIRAGDVRPNPDLARWLAGGDEDRLRRQVEHYCAELERAGKYQLFLWPPHCILGSDGHPLAGLIHEARMFHAYARTAQSRAEVKGTNPLTENYSVLRPEVLTRFDGAPLAEPNAGLVETLLRADAVVIAGQAASHCVKSTIDDLLDALDARGARDLARRVYILADCMSAVAIPDGAGGFVADFTPDAEAALDRFREAGMHVVRSTDPLESWPGLALPRR